MLIRTFCPSGLRQGRIESIVVVPNQTRFLGLFGSGTDVIIPWKHIVKIGADVVLVKLEDVRPYRQTDDTEGVYEFNRQFRN